MAYSLAPARILASTWPLGLVVALLVPSGCGDPEGCEEPLGVCDISQGSCQAHVFTQTACSRGQAASDPPPVSTITREELAELLRSDVPPTEEQVRQDAQIATALRMLDLLPQGAVSNEDAAIAAYASNVIAFYSRSEQDVTIVSTNVAELPREATVFVLAHEFVHVLQDRDVGLQDFFDEHSTTADSVVALRSVTEGEAVHFSNLTMARRRGAGIDAEAFERYYAESQDGLRAAAIDDGRTGSEAQYTELTASFPYPFGGQLVTQQWYADGMAGVLDLYDAPPPSTAEILRTLAGEGSLPLDPPHVVMGTPPEGWSAVAEDTLGAWVVYAVAGRHGIADADAFALALDWAGDRFVLMGGSVEAEVAFAWELRFGSEASARAFAAIDATAPPEGARAVRVEGRDVTIVMAVDADALAQWEAVFPPQAVVEPGASLATPRSAAPRGLPGPIVDPRAPRRSR